MHIKKNQTSMRLLPKSVVPLLLLFLWACNKNSNQLPRKNPPPEKLVITAKLNGLSTIDFVFEQHVTKDSNWVNLYIRNTTTDTLNRLHYLIELCKAAEKTYDTCDLQLIDSIRQNIPPGEISQIQYQWTNKNIKLDANLITAGIIYSDRTTLHPLANAYDNIYGTFEGDAPVYAVVRGYILADGNATFRYKTIKGENYNAQGLFTADKNVFNGTLTNPKEHVAQFMLDSITVSSTKKLIDESNGTLQFRLKLNPHLTDSTRSILTLVNKHY